MAPVKVMDRKRTTHGALVLQGGGDSLSTFEFLFFSGRVGGWGRALCFGLRGREGWK